MSDSEEETFAELPAWAHIQKKTFTKWCNEQLKKRELTIEDLQTSLRDGVVLLNLVELLTQKQSKTRHNRSPRIKPQMVENIGIALKLLTDDGVKLVNIGNGDIYAGNIKLILGLIWTLILRYQISVDFRDGERDGGGSAKKELMKWATDLVNSLPGVEVKNFTTDWNDGLALCSMVEAVAPGLCPEYAGLDPANALENAQLGLDRAEEGLGVPKILDAVDLINPDIDELSVLTYVSLIKNATPSEDIVPFDPLKVTIYGPGTDVAFVNIPTYFMVNTNGAGRGELKVTILDSNGDVLPSELEKDDEGVTKVQYTPLIAGVHNFNVTYAAQPVPNGQFKVRVIAPSDATKVKLYGEGITTAYVGKEAQFTIDAEGAGEGPLELTIISPDEKVPCEISDLGNGKFDVKYIPQSPGPMSILIKWCNDDIQESPIKIQVLEELDPMKVVIGTVGLDECVAKEPVKFTVCTAGAGTGDLEVEVFDNDNNPIKVAVNSIGEDTDEVSFTPDIPGLYKVNVLWSGLPVPNGEMNLQVKEPIDLSKCVISELGNPCVDAPTVFTVDVSGCGPVDADDLMVNVVGPDNKPLEVTIERVPDDKTNGMSYVLSTGKPLAGPDGKPLVRPNSRALVGPDGEPLVAIGPDGRSLVGPDGKPLLGPDGKPLVLSDGKPLVGPDGESLVDPDGNLIVGPDGKSLLGPDGKPLLGPDGTPLQVGPDGKSLVGPDGAPLVADDGTPLIFSDGRPLLNAMSYIVSTGQPLTGPDGRALVGPNCRALVGPDGKPLVAIGPDGKSLVGPDGKPLLGPDGKPLVLSNGKPLVGPDGKSLVDPDGNLIVGPDGQSLIGPDGKPLIGPDGTPLEVGPDQRSLVGPDGSPLVGTDGKPLIFSDGKPLLEVGPDGMSFVLSDGKPLIGADGTPLTGPNSRSLLGPDGKPLVAIGPDGKSLVGPDGKPLLGLDGKPFALSDGKPLVGPDGESLVDPDGNLLVGPDGKSLIGPDGKPLLGPDGTPLQVGPDGKSLVGPDGLPLLGPDDKPLIFSDGKPLLELGPDSDSFVLSDGRPIIGPDGRPLTGPNARSLLGPDGKPLVAIGPDGKSLVGPDGKPLLGPDGKPYTLADGKPLVGPDGESLVGPEGNLIVGPDGTSLIGPDGKPLLGPDGTPLQVGPDGKSLVGPNGLPLLGPDDKPLLFSDGKAPLDNDSDGKCLIGPDGKPLEVGPDGTSLLKSDGKPLLGPDGEPLQLGPDGKSLIGPDGKPLLGPDGEPIEVKHGLAPGVYNVSYTAKAVGPHKVNVKVQDMHVPGSAFSVHSVDPRKVLVTFEVDYQTWYQTQDIPVGEPVEIGLLLAEAGPGQLGIQLSAPPGSGTDCRASEVAPGKMTVIFTPTSVGDHLVNLTFDDQLIPNTPVTVRVIPKANAGAVKVYGDGLSNGNVGDPARFTIDINGAGKGGIELKINGPRGELDAPMIEVGQGLYEVSYIPQDEGVHVIMVKFADQHVPGSAFRATIEKAVSPDSVVAYGKGLEEGTPGTDNEFYVDSSRAGQGDLKIEILGPQGVIQPVISNITNHHYKILYSVPAEGNYTVNILWSDVNIPKSPFNINVRTPFNPASVLCQGPGLMLGTVGKVSLFEVDCRAAGNAPLNINVEDDDQNLIPVKVVETQPNCYDVSFVPQTPVPHHVNVLWNDFNIRGSPFKINVLARPEKDLNLGGEGKIRVYYSTTTSSEQIRHNCRFLQSLLERKKVHLRPDFEPWIPIDIGMDREERNKIFEKAECRKTPMLFIDDQYVGGYDEVLELDEVGEMDRLLSYCTLKYRNLQTVEEARKADELARLAEMRDSL